MTNEDKALGERLLLADCKLDGRKLEDYADQLCREAAATIARLGAENEALKSDVIAFCGPWAVQWARERGWPKGMLHPVHYDIIERAGARMADFTKADSARPQSTGRNAT